MSVDAAVLPLDRWGSIDCVGHETAAGVSRQRTPNARSTIMKVGAGDTAAIDDARCIQALTRRSCCAAHNNVFLADP
jgi:hypothetical protein